MRAAVSDLKGETRRTEKVRAVAEPPTRAQPASLLAAVPVAPNPVGMPPLITPDKKMVYGALTIFPGGFFAADVFRSRATNAEMTIYSMNIPFGPQAGIDEAVSAPGSRASPCSSRLRCRRA